MFLVICIEIPRESPAMDECTGENCFDEISWTSADILYRSADPGVPHRVSDNPEILISSGDPHRTHISFDAASDYSWNGGEHLWIWPFAQSVGSLSQSLFRPRALRECEQCQFMLSRVSN